MKAIKVTLKKLFQFLEATENPYDELLKTHHDISVKTPTGYSPLLGVIRKKDTKVEVKTDSGNTVTCGSKHIFINENGENVFCKNAVNIKTTTGIEKIISKKDKGEGDMYDIAIKSPHLYVTPNGLIHHNTTFIKNLIYRSGKNAKVAYDEKVMANDAFFASFIDDNSQFLIMEDADTFLRARADGNSMMHKFLNVSDGLISAPDKKLVFSTNIPNINDIDPALIRPGRCFDVLEFRLLSVKEAEKIVIESKGGHIPKDKEYISLAEIFSIQPCSNPVNKKGIGFI